MKFRKLIMGLLLGILVFNFTGIDAFAAEGTNDNTGITTQAVTDSEAAQITVTTEAAATTDTAVTTETAATTDTAVTTDVAVTAETPVVADTSVNAESSDETTLFAETDSAAESDAADAEVTDTEEAEDAAVTENTDAAEVSEKDTTEETKTSEESDKKVATKTAEVKYTKAQLRLLSALVYCEAQSESYNGKLAVAIVVMNRVRSSLYPDSLKSVIYQRYQFSPVNNGTLNKALAEYDAGRFTSNMEKACIKAAKAALSGEKSITVNGKEKNFSKYLYFSVWLRGASFQLGNHQFK